MESHGKSVLGKNLDLKFESLGENNIAKIKSFHSGNDVLDKYFKQEAIKDTTSKTFLILDTLDNIEEIVGLYTLCCSGYIIESHDKYYIYPAVEIKYFAMNDKYQDILFSNEQDDCLSGCILSVIIGYIMNFTENYCGANKIILYSVPNAVNFYKRSGFKPFENYMLKSNERYLEDCTPMYFDLNEFPS